MKVRVETEVQTWVTRDSDPDDRWDRDDTDSSLSDLSVFAVDNESFDRYDDFEVEGVEVGDPVFVVVCKYSSGDTFGRNDGQIEIMDVFATANEAYKLIDVLENDPSEVKSKNGRYIETRFSVDYNGKTYRKPWVGYFEYLESLTVERSWVQRAQKERRYW